MLPFSPTVADQIRFLLQSLNKSNYDLIFRELTQFTEYGSEGCILLFQTCLEQINCRDGDMHLKLAVFSAILRYLMGRPNFATVICESLKNNRMGEDFLADISKTLQLTSSEKIGLGLALSECENLDLRARGQNFCMTHIEQICTNLVPLSSHEQIQSIFIFLSQSQGLAKYLDSFMKMLSLLNVREGTLTLLPVIPGDLAEVNSLRQLDVLFEHADGDFDAVLAEIEKEMSMADIVRELGYGCTVNVSHCKELLSLFLPLNEMTLARIFSTIVQTSAGIDDSQNAHSTFCSAFGINVTADFVSLNSWNIGVLVDSVKQLVPEVNWISVMENMDHEGFYFPDERAFTLFMSIYNTATQDSFPLHAVCGSVWDNAEGQLSFLRYAVSAPPEVFTFAHSLRKLPYIDSQFKHQLGDANQAWFCLDLVDVLCQLAEKGHASTVRTIIESPLNQCPDVLLMGLAYCNSSFNLLQREVSFAVFPVIVGDSRRYDIIQNLWNVNSNLVVRGFTDVHNVNRDGLNEIFDICQKLKILSSVLDIAPFPFSINLAVLASKKEQLNLENWLNENLNTYKDIFFEGCLRFLKEILSDSASDNSTNASNMSGISVDIHAETVPIFFKVLHVHLGQLTSSSLTEEMKRLHVAVGHANSRLQSSGLAHTFASDGFPEDVEAEAYSYFHQTFSGQLSVDAMLQMLARFKDSPVKREQSIFEWIIKNILEECKFYPKYPEKQLKIAAILFGSAIKHRLVGHLTLGVALRYILDALRKSVDSKMFAFGVKALEQFIDRMIEWPQYCNHILQISHLRGTHAELVAFVDRALARITSSQSESNVSHSGVVDLHQGHVMLESMELAGSSAGDSVQQVTPFQLQQRHHGVLDESMRQKFSSAASGPVKPQLLSSGQISAGSKNVDLLGNNQKGPSTLSLPLATSVNSAIGLASFPPSPGFLRSSRGLASSGILRQHSYSTGFGAALNIETLVAAAEQRDTPIESPPSEIQDKILFMINNISAANTEVKAKEFTEILKEEYYPWFAQYMVMKRASIEPNFHDLYLKFLDKVNSRVLNKEIVKATYENCKVLLRSELIKSSSEERSLLKNLGSWLGKFTIGRNQALRAREIDPKVLITEAYEKGLMIAVIPFTSKILEPCQCSLAYQPPNPWTMGILSLLSEIYALPNLKMNLKFDIEVLFKNLGVDMKEVKPTSLLKDRVREIEGNPDFSTKDIMSQPQMLAEVNSGMLPALNQVEHPSDIVNPSHAVGHANILSQYNTTSLHLVSSTMGDDEKIGSLSLSERLLSGPGHPQVTPSHTSFSVGQHLTPFANIGGQVVINQKLSALGLQLPFQRIVPIAVERGVREIMSPVVNRSVNIAIRTTREIVLKDYSMESDDNRVFNAAHLMVASLAGSLAHVTCKELLRVAITNQMKSLLQALNVGADFLEQAVSFITNDNLDLGCALIEQAATEKALQTIDAEIAPQLMLRRKQREGVGAQFFDASTYTQNPFARVPELLRPKPGRLSIAQQRVYEDFVRYPWQNQPSQSSNIGPPVVVSSGGSAHSALSRVYGSSLGQPNSNLYGAAHMIPGGGTISHSLDIMTEEDAQLISASSNHTSPSDSIFLHVSDATSIPSAVGITELHSVESFSTTKESTALVQISLAPSVDRLGGGVSEPLLTTGDALDRYQIVAHKLEVLVANEASNTDLQQVIAEAPEIILKCVSRDEAALAVAQKVFKSLYENANSMHITAHLAILASIRDVCKLVVKELTSWVIYSDEERKFNRNITIGLIRSDLLNLAEYNMHLAKLIDGGRNKAATDFAISLVQTLVFQETGVSVSEFYNLVDALSKLAARSGAPESLQQLVEIARNAAANLSAKDEKARQFRDRKLAPVARPSMYKEDYAAEPSTADPVGFRDQVTLLFGEWYRICELPGKVDVAASHYVLQLQQSNLLKGDEMTDHFFRILMELAVGHCLVSEGFSSNPLSLNTHQQGQHISYIAIDMFAKLVVFILKFSVTEQGSNRSGLLPKILAVTIRIVQKDAEEKKASFNPRPYFRLFINWLFDLGLFDSSFEGASLQTLTAFANAFHALQPVRVPGFSFAWLELVSHRNFLPKLLMSPAQKGWPFVQRLLVDLLKFLEPYLRNVEFGDAIQLLYKGTLRVLLVLLHDFPEFLCDYHFNFCDVIPITCIQMRNIVLSAFPRNMKLPDPATPNLKIDLLAEISQPPQILSDVDAALKARLLKGDVDEYLKTKQGPLLLAELKQKLLLTQSEVSVFGTRYNISLINSLVLYVGMQAIQQLQSKSSPQMHTGQMDLFSAGAAMDIFQALIRDLDLEGRYLVLNAVANQLRYPNNHTHYFSFVLLYLFAESKQEIIQEQITKVLLERLIVNRPHPWGLLITFIELIKNPRYEFWSRSFTHSTPELKKLFESVSRSCGGPKPVDDGMVSGGI